MPTTTKKKVFGASGPKKLKTFPKPESDDFKPIEHVGATVILTVHGVEDVKTNRYGVRPLVKVDVRVVAEDGTIGPALKKVGIFSTAIIGQLEDLTGSSIVAVIETYESKSGGDAPRLSDDYVEISDPNDDKEIAEALEALADA